MHELTIEEEIAALWCELAADALELPVDELLKIASTAVADLLSFAQEYDASVAAMRDGTAAAPIGPQINAQTA